MYPNGNGKIMFSNEIAATVNKNKNGSFTTNFIDGLTQLSWKDQNGTTFSNFSDGSNSSTEVLKNGTTKEVFFDKNGQNQTTLSRIEQSQNYKVDTYFPNGTYKEIITIRQSDGS